MTSQNALPRRVGIYCRLSYAPDGSVEKVERQEDDCRALAGRLGWPVSERHIYRDNSRSAWQRNRRRPAWDRMLAAIEAGEIDAIVVYHGDRLIRQPWDLEKLINIAENRSIRIASPSGTRDLDSPDDRFILRIEAAQACRESDNTSRRVNRALDARVRRGLTQVGGRRPLGYGVQVGTRLKVDKATGAMVEVPVYDTTQQVETEATYLADAADRLLAGQSQGGVLRWLDEEGVRSTEGHPLSAKTLRNLLLAPRIAGLIERDGELYEAAWDGILSRETWEDIRALYERSGREHPYAGRERVHLLTGIAECSGCHGTVRAKPTGGRNRKASRLYYCWNPSCTARVGRNVAHLDAYVSGRVLRLLSDTRFVAELRADDGSSGVGQQIAALERRRAQVAEQLSDLAEHGDLDPLLLAKSLASFDRKIADLRAASATTARRRLLLRMTGITRDQWEAEPVDIRAATVQALVRVIILPTARRGPGFDPTSVEVRRRSLEPNAA